MRIDPYLNFDGTCAEAFRFYAEVLGGKLALQTHGESPLAGVTGPESRDRILHARLEMDDAVLMGSDSMPGRHERPQGLWVSISVDEPERADRIFTAFTDRGTSVMPIQETFWARRFGMVVDRFGTPWMVNCEKPDQG